MAEEQIAEKPQEKKEQVRDEKFMVVTYKRRIGRRKPEGRMARFFRSMRSQNVGIRSRRRVNITREQIRALLLKQRLAKMQEQMKRQQKPQNYKQTEAYRNFWGYQDVVRQLENEVHGLNIATIPNVAQQIERECNFFSNQGNAKGNASVSVMNQCSMHSKAVDINPTLRTSIQADFLSRFLLP